MTKTICTSLSLQSVFLYQLQPHAQHEHTIVDSVWDVFVGFWITWIPTHYNLFIRLSSGW